MAREELTSMFLRVLILLVVLYCLCENALAAINRDEPSGEFRFDPVHSRMETYLVSDDAVINYMEMDLFVPGNVLYVDYCTIKTTDGDEIWNIAGDQDSCYQDYADGVGDAAKFNKIGGFHQINSSHIIVMDTNNHRVRMLNRFTNMTTHLAGKCVGWFRLGFQDGVGCDAHFRFPESTIADVRNPDKLLITDRANHAVRQISVNTGEVSTFFQTNKSSRFYPRSITQDSQTGHIYMSSVLNTVHRLGYDDRILTTIAGDTHSRYEDRVGSLLETRFYIALGVLLVENNTKLVVADSFHDKLKVLDLMADTSYDICSGLVNPYDGNLANCSHAFPKSLMLSGDTLYVGTPERIRTIRNYDIMRRVMVRASYVIQCSALNEPDIHRDLLRRLSKKWIVNSICTDYECCGKNCEAPRKFGWPRWSRWYVELECTDDMLSVTWPTSLVYSEDTRQMPASLRTRMERRLQMDEMSRNLELSTITLQNIEPIRVFPTMREDGTYGEVLFTSLCLDTNKTYSEEEDRCI